MKTIFSRFSTAQIVFSASVMLAVIALFAFGHPAEALLVAPATLADLEPLIGEIKTTQNAMKGTHDTLTEQFKELKGRLDSGDNSLTKLNESIDSVLTKHNEHGLELKELNQKLAALETARSDGADAEKSWGQQFVEGAAFKASGGSSFSGSVRAEIKAVTSTAAGGLIRSQRESGVLNLMRERRVLRDLLPTVSTNTSSVDYARQATRTNAAAPVAESAAKPYSDFTWDSATVVVRVLAHLAKVTRQAMDDAPRLMGEIDSEMRYGLGFVEERQFLFGNNTGQNLHGIMPQATTFARPAGITQMTGATNLDVLRIAMLINALALMPADGVVLSEVDWAVIELLKTTDGAYLMSNPAGQLAPRLWGLPVVTTPAMTVGDFLVGNFAIGATIYDRMSVEVLISTENADDFEKNLATVRAEERVAIAVKRPTAFTKGTFATARAALAAA